MTYQQKKKNVLHKRDTFKFQQHSSPNLNCITGIQDSIYRLVI
jgi:hypothetical protein